MEDNTTSKQLFRTQALIERNKYKHHSTNTDLYRTQQYMNTSFNEGKKYLL